MTDIFISYAHEDHELVRILVPKLEAEGFSVWWDHTIPPGKTWDEVIAKGIADAKCCIVVWSQHSVGSDWVKEEATMAKEGRKFIPVQIDGSEPPVGFRRIQAANLQGWRGEPSNAQWQLLVREARAIVTAAREGGGGASVPPSRPSYAYAPPPAAEPEKKSPPIALIGMVSAGAVALLVVGVMLMNNANTPTYEAPAIEATAPASEADYTDAGPTASPTSTPAPAAQANALDGLMGTWTRTSAAGTCRDTYAFRRSGNQVIWTQNQDEYPRDFTVSGQRVTLGSSWQFEPSGNTLNIYDDNQLICSFRRGGSGGAPAAASVAVVGDWSGEFIRTYNNPPSRSPLNITFNANGTTDQGAQYTLNGNRITFMLDGIHAMEGTVRGNRITGTWTYSSLRGEWEVTRGGAAATAPSQPSPVGSWNLRTVWSDGETANATFNLRSDGGFTTSQGGVGVWTQNGNRLEMRFTNGEARCVYYGTFTQNSARGDVPASPQCFGGTFTMSR